MNTIIRVIQSTLSVIIWSRAAALHRCHCCAVNASVITATANMAQSQKRLSGVRGEEIISATKTRQLLPKMNFSPRFLFIFLLFHLPSTRRRKKERQSKQETPSSVFFTTRTVYLSQFLSLSLLVFFMHCPRGIFLLPSEGAASATLLCSRSG